MMKRDVARGDMTTLILSVLAVAPGHGYAIARTIEHDTEGALHLREGTLYPALRSLEQQAFIISVWETDGGGPARKVYTITETGRDELAKRTREWQSYVAAMSAVLTKRSLRHA